MTNEFLKWSNEISEKIEKLKHDIGILENHRDTEYVKFKVKQIKSKFKFATWCGVSYSDTEWNLYSDFSRDALIKVYKDELDRLISIYEESTEENYMEL